jgi:cyclopropane fatty-acyl-phospholipid synthase-like methyltransferase
MPQVLYSAAGRSGMAGRGEIKSMNLYSQVDRIYNELQALGIGDDAPLSVATLTPFDQYHYHGTDAVDAAVAGAGITAGSRVLDVGSGLGGPARYLADTTGCRVTAIELQADLNAVAGDLTRRCGLGDRIEHVEANVLSWAAPVAAYDALVSWLAFYHIPEPERLWAQCAAALRPGAQVYVEDLYALGTFAADEMGDLRDMIYGQSMLSRERYLEILREAGFGDIVFEDVTVSWSRFCRERVGLFRAGQARFEAVHGAGVFGALDAFHGAVNRLFEGGNMGGVRLTARRL